MLTFQAISLFHWWSDGQCPSWFLEFCFHSCRYLGLTQFYTVVSDSVWFYLIFILTRSYIPVIFQVHMVSSYAWFLHNFIESGHHFVPPWKSDLRDRVFISIWFDYVFFWQCPSVAQSTPTSRSRRTGAGICGTWIRTTRTTTDCRTRTWSCGCARPPCPPSANSTAGSTATSPASSRASRPATIPSTSPTVSRRFFCFVLFLLSVTFRVEKTATRWHPVVDSCRLSEWSPTSSTTTTTTTTTIFIDVLTKGLWGGQRTACPLTTSWLN